MFKHIRQILTAAVLALVVVAPASAYARFDLNPPAPSGASVPVQAPSVARATASSPQGFQWGDAGIGAAGMIVLLGTGAAASGTVRRRRVIG